MNAFQGLTHKKNEEAYNIISWPNIKKQQYNQTSFKNAISVIVEKALDLDSTFK